MHRQITVEHNWLWGAALLWGVYINPVCLTGGVVDDSVQHLPACSNLFMQTEMTHIGTADLIKLSVNSSVCTKSLCTCLIRWSILVTYCDLLQQLGLEI